MVANETVGGEELLNELSAAPGACARRCSSSARVELASSGTGCRTRIGARDAAQERLEASLEAMRAAGIEARGEIGDGDPLQAIEDAIRTFAPDELIISTHPRGTLELARARPRRRRTRERFALPVTHVVVDLAQDELARTARTEPRPRLADVVGRRRPR